MLRMGSIAFLAGLVIIIVSTLFHASSEDLMNNPVVFAVYAESDTWIALLILVNLQVLCWFLLVGL